MAAMPVPEGLAAAIVSNAHRLLDTPIPQNLSADTAAGLRHAIDSAYGSAFGYAMALNLSLACAALLVALCCRQACVIRELAAV
jgi:hypothetical protein